MTLRLPFGCKLIPLLVGLLLFAAALTPSLIPRGGLMQGVLGGVVAALGQLVGRFFLGLWQVLMLPEPDGPVARLVGLLLALATLAVAGLCVALAGDWQDGIRLRMGLEPAGSAHGLRMLAVALAVFAVLLLAGAALRALYRAARRRLSRLLPERTADDAGLVLVIVVLFGLTRDGVSDRVMAALDRSCARSCARCCTPRGLRVGPAPEPRARRPVPRRQGPAPPRAAGWGGRRPGPYSAPR